MEETQLSSRQQSLQERLFANRLEQLGYTCVTTCSDEFTITRFVPVEEPKKTKKQDLKENE